MVWCFVALDLRAKLAEGFQNTSHGTFSHRLCAVELVGATGLQAKHGGKKTCRRPGIPHVNLRLIGWPICTATCDLNRICCLFDLQLDSQSLQGFAHDPGVLTQKTALQLHFRVTQGSQDQGTVRDALGARNLKSAVDRFGKGLDGQLIHIGLGNVGRDEK